MLTRESLIDPLPSRDRKGVDYASCFLIGSSRIRLPVAANIALQMAGDMGGTPGSPTPAGGSELGTI